MKHTHCRPVHKIERIHSSIEAQIRSNNESSLQHADNIGFLNVFSCRNLDCFYSLCYTLYSEKEAIGILNSS